MVKVRFENASIRFKLAAKLQKQRNQQPLFKKNHIRNMIKTHLVVKSVKIVLRNVGFYLTNSNVSLRTL